MCCKAMKATSYEHHESSIDTDSFFVYVCTILHHPCQTLCIYSLCSSDTNTLIQFTFILLTLILQGGRARGHYSNHHCCLRVLTHKKSPGCSFACTEYTRTVESNTLTQPNEGSENTRIRKGENKLVRPQYRYTMLRTKRTSLWRDGGHAVHC